MRKPNPLREGDMIVITAASGPVNPEKLSAGIKILEGMGLHVRIAESCYASHEYLAGTDALRLRDLHDAFGQKNKRHLNGARRLRRGTPSAAIKLRANSPQPENLRRLQRRNCPSHRPKPILQPNHLSRAHARRRFAKRGRINVKVIL